MKKNATPQFSTKNGIDSPAGDFDIAVKGGKRVKKYYLKKLAQTITLIEELEEEEQWKET